MFDFTARLKAFLVFAALVMGAALLIPRLTPDPAPPASLGPSLGEACFDLDGNGNVTDDCPPNTGQTQHRFDQYGRVIEDPRLERIPVFWLDGAVHWISVCPSSGQGRCLLYGTNGEFLRSEEPPVFPPIRYGLDGKRAPD